MIILLAQLVYSIETLFWTQRSLGSILEYWARNIEAGFKVEKNTSLEQWSKPWGCIFNIKGFDICMFFNIKGFDICMLKTDCHRIHSKDPDFLRVMGFECSLGRFCPESSTEAEQKKHSPPTAAGLIRTRPHLKQLDIYPPWKLTCPWKGTILKGISFSIHQFSGDMLVFREGNYFYLLPSHFCWYHKWFAN